MENKETVFEDVSCLCLCWVKTEFSKHRYQSFCSQVEIAVVSSKKSEIDPYLYIQFKFYI